MLLSRLVIQLWVQPHLRIQQPWAEECQQILLPWVVECQQTRRQPQAVVERILWQLLGL
jgi:hypothetical protein